MNPRQESFFVADQSGGGDRLLDSRFQRRQLVKTGESPAPFMTSPNLPSYGNTFTQGFHPTDAQQNISPFRFFQPNRQMVDAIAILAIIELQ